MKKVTVQYLPDYNYSQLLTAGQHSFIADEPGEKGGNDLGPGPYELLLWALGACTAMTVLMYARRKEWPVDDISVHLTHDRVYMDDMAGTADGEVVGRVEVIEREISVRGKLTDEQRDRLLEIADRCPVHRTLISGPKITSSIVVGE
ncbi:MAG: OsmC family protein [Dehalococcoidia bacterium]